MVTLSRQCCRVTSSVLLGIYSYRFFSHVLFRKYRYFVFFWYPARGIRYESRFHDISYGTPTLVSKLSKFNLAVVCCRTSSRSTTPASLSPTTRGCPAATTSMQTISKVSRKQQQREHCFCSFLHF